MQVVNEQKELLSPDKFVFWLQGFCEINGAVPTEQQWVIIKEHLELCFKKVTVQELPKQPASVPPNTIPNTHTIEDWNKMIGKTEPYSVAIC